MRRIVIDRITIRLPGGTRAEARRIGEAAAARVRAVVSGTAASPASLRARVTADLTRLVREKRHGR
jgi:hypothetical protein